MVHFHHGASRTGLALRAWLMHTNGWDDATATAHLRTVWPELSVWNTAFTHALDAWASGR